MGEIRRVFHIRVPFTIELIPNDVEDGTTLYFGLMEFVQEVEQVAEKTKKIKCVVWDLDNTLWDGVLVEHGPEIEVTPGNGDDSHSGRPRNPAFHRQQDNRDEAMKVLKQFNIDEYFFVRRFRGNQERKHSYDRSATEHRH